MASLIAGKTKGKTKDTGKRNLAFRRSSYSLSISDMTWSTFILREFLMAMTVYVYSALTLWLHLHEISAQVWLGFGFETSKMFTW